MRHNVAGRLFSRPSNQRKALLRNLVASLVEHQRIETTLAKAKETRKIAEKLVTLGKRGGLHAMRVAMTRLPHRGLVQKLFDEIAPRFKDRNGGYTRIVQTRHRLNDSAQMAILEFVDYETAVAVDAKKKPAKKEKKEAAATASTAAEKPKKEAKPKAEKPKKEAKPKAEKAAKKAKAAPAKATAKPRSKKGE